MEHQDPSFRFRLKRVSSKWYCLQNIFFLSALPVDFLFAYSSFIELSSELQVKINTDDLYFKFDKKNFKPVSFSKSFDDFAFKDKEVNILYFILLVTQQNFVLTS